MLKISIIAISNLFLHFYLVLLWWNEFDKYRPIPTLVIFGILYFSSTTLVWWLVRRGSEKVFNLVLILGSIFFSIFLVDLFLFFEVFSIGKRTELTVIPQLRKIFTREGYLIGTQEPFFSKKDFTPGQISNYFPDSGFYEPRLMAVETDEMGLRNSKLSFKNIQKIILMGDSFTFGWGVDQSFVWASLLAQDTNANVYNLGVYGVGPSNHVELLHYLLEEENLKLAKNPIFILLIFEGNDFVDPNVYDRKIKSKTKFQIKYIIPKFYKRGVVRNFGKAMKKFMSLGFHSENPNWGYIYNSPQFGQVGFRNDYIKMTSEVSGNLEKSLKLFESSNIDLAFQRLKEISLKYNAETAVFYCPTKSRIYGKYFPEHPTVPEEDNLKILTKNLTKEAGFNFLDLGIEFNDFAEKGDLLFWRDDTHLNNLGNKVVAVAVAKFINSLE